MDKIIKEGAIKEAMSYKLFYEGHHGNDFTPILESFMEVNHFNHSYYLMRTTNPSVVAYVFNGEFYLTKTSNDKRQFLKLLGGK
jgi:hypothetical protein